MGTAVTHTDESNYSQTSCEDSSTMNFNQSILEHTDSTDKIQQSSVKKNRLSSHSSVSNSKNRILNEMHEFPYSPTSPEDVYTLDTVNSDLSASENQQNINLTSTSSLPTSNPTSVIEDKNKIDENLAFVKREPRKRTSNVMEEAIEAFKKIRNEKLSISQSSPRTPIIIDTYEHLSTRDFNQSNLKHTYSTDKIQQSPHSSLSNDKSHTLNEMVESPYSPTSSKKGLPISQSPPRTPTTIDAYEHLGLFIVARLREMKRNIHLRCEIEIIKILNTIETIGTRETNN